jgi:hypothetical protein
MKRTAYTLPSTATCFDHLLRTGRELNKVDDYIRAEMEGRGDAVLAWPLLKKGGLLTFDDYEWEGDPDPLHCPGVAINAFLSIFETHYAMIHKGYQIMIEKI